MSSKRQLKKDLWACKIAGVCERDRIANKFMRERMEITLATQRTLLECLRAEKELPVCPPICPDIIDAEVVV